VITLEKQETQRPARGKSFLRIRVGEANVLASYRFWKDVMECISGVRVVVPKSDHLLELFVERLIIKVPGDGGRSIKLQLANFFGTSREETTPDSELKKSFSGSLEASLLACYNGRESFAIMEGTSFAFGAETRAGMAPKLSVTANLALRLNSEHLLTLLAVVSSTVPPFGDVAEAEGDAAPTFTLLFQLPRLSLTLDTTDALKATGSPLQLALIEAVESSLLVSSERQMLKVGFIADSLSVIDSRTSHRSILLLGHKQGKKPTVEPLAQKSPPALVMWVTQQQQDSRKTAVALSLEQLRVDFVPDFIQDLYSQYYEIVRQLIQLSNKPRSSSTQTIPEFSLSVLGLSVIFPESAGEFSVQLGCYTRFNEREVYALFENVSIARSSSATIAASSSSAQHQQLLRLFDVSVRWIRLPLEAASLSISMSALRFTVAPQDILSAGRFLEFSKWFPLPAQSLSDGTSSSSSSMSPDAAATSLPVAFPNLCVKTCGLRVLLLADRSYKSVPLLKIKCTAFELNSKTSQAEVEAVAAMSWKASFFNLSRTSWEPLLEPWECQLTIAGQPKTPWDLRVSLAFYKCLVSGVLSPSSSSRRSAPFHPVMLRNLSGVKLTIILGRDEPPLVVEPGQDIPVPQQDYSRSLSTRDKKKKKNSVALRFEGYSGQQLLSHEKLKATELSLPSSNDEDDPAMFVMSIALQDGSKMLTISSPVVVENKTTLPLVFRVQRGQSVVFTSAPLEVGKQAGVPPSFLQER
jgi:hypothetical protein